VATAIARFGRDSIWRGANVPLLP